MVTTRAFASGTHRRADSCRSWKATVSGSVVNSVEFSPDGSKIVSGSGDKSICIWDAADQRNPHLPSAAVLVHKIHVYKHTRCGLLKQLDNVISIFVGGYLMQCPHTQALTLFFLSWLAC